MTTASATAGLTRLNCLICCHQAPRSPVPSLVIRLPVTLRPAVQKGKAVHSWNCLRLGRVQGGF